MPDSWHVGSGTPLEPSNQRRPGTARHETSQGHMVSFGDVIRANRVPTGTLVTTSRLDPFPGKGTSSTLAAAGGLGRSDLVRGSKYGFATPPPSPPITSLPDRRPKTEAMDWPRTFQLISGPSRSPPPSILKCCSTP